MEGLRAAEELTRSGRFGDALKHLEKGRVMSTERLAAQTIKTQLLERVGRFGESSALARTILVSTSAHPSQRSACEQVLGRIAMENGQVEIGLTHLQRAVSLARDANDLTRLCWGQINLMLVLAERSGPDAAAPLIADLRLNTTKLGEPSVTAGLHIYVGEILAKRGQLRAAEWHSKLALRLLRTVHNVWLEAAAENTLLAIAIIQSDHAAGLEHGYRAVDLAEQSGSLPTLRAALGNLGNVFLAKGDFDQAVEYFHRALSTLPSDGQQNNANLDGLARVRLAQDRTDDCRELLDRIDDSIQAEDDQALYPHRYARLTRIQLFAQQGRTNDALEHSDDLLKLARRLDDKLLSTTTILVQAELLYRLGRIADSIAALRSVIFQLASSPPDMFAHYERIVGCALFSNGSTAALHHWARAKRICLSLHNGPGLIELNRSRPGMSNESLLPAMTPTSHESATAAILHDIATMLLHVGRPEIVAFEALDVLSGAGCIEAGHVIAKRIDAPDEILAHVGQPECTETITQERVFIIGHAGARVIELAVRPRGDLESVSTVNALALLIGSARELERARAEREERATLWPADEQPADGRTVLTGHMREQMSLAQRVANANVNVLITGESGTGKEILARAIHDYSDRARKPFVPFNCAAVPRDLLESQLFGHRRGAFTGADHDQLGLIRAAQGGTLFLDEIGELAPTLQPKLLRFLESGEIAPLGEPAPITVNVRVVAATNSHLEDAVRSGQFREDLFYRLNVVRLSLRPLRERRDEIPSLVNHFVARTALESQKGHVTIAEETMERLILYRWPGNVRQLQNELRRMVAMSEPNSTLEPDAIAADILGALPVTRPAPINGREIAIPLHDKLLPTLARVEGEMIKAAFREHHGKVEAIAKALGISRKGLYLKRQRLGL